MEQDLESRPDLRLLAVATKRIAHHGLDNLDVRSLCLEAKVSTSQFSRYYGQKDQLVKAVFEQGWEAAYEYVVPALMRPSRGLEHVVEAVLDALVDALENDREKVSAALIVVHSRKALGFRSHLQGTDAHSRFFRMVGQLQEQFQQRSLSPQQAKEALELVYGAMLHRLVLATPLCEGTAPPFDRDVFVEFMVKMVRSFLAPSKADADADDAIESVATFGMPGA